MFEEIVRLAGAFGIQIVVFAFWYYVASRTGSF
jgi:hypothetical protein